MLYFYGGIMNYEEMHEVAQYLYKLLDDIDTVSDIAKSRDKLYRRMVENIQSAKGAVVQDCDGYTVTFRVLPKAVEPTLVDVARDALIGC
jgi:hypothetical protein